MKFQYMIWPEGKYTKDIFINDIDFLLLNLVSNHQPLITIVLQNGHSVVRKVVY